MPTLILTPHSVAPAVFLAAYDAVKNAAPERLVVVLQMEGTRITSLSFVSAWWASASRTLEVGTRIAQIMKPCEFGVDIVPESPSLSSILRRAK